MLFKRVQIGDLNISNRIVLAPLTRGRCGYDRIPKAHVVEYYQQRISAGLLITEAAAISRQAVGWAGTPGIFEGNFYVHK